MSATGATAVVHGLSMTPGVLTIHVELTGPTFSPTPTPVFTGATELTVLPQT